MDRSENNWQNTYLEQDGRVIFLGLCLFQITLIFIQEDIIGFRADFFALLNDIGEDGLLYWLLRLKEIGGYLIVPIQIFLEVTATGLMLFLGIFTFGYKADYKDMRKVAVLSYPALFIPQMLKILWFGFINRDYTEFELDHFHNFSLSALWPIESRLSTGAELASQINPGMIVYIWLLSLLLGVRLKRDLKSMLWISLIFVFGIGLVWNWFVLVVK